MLTLVERVKRLEKRVRSLEALPGGTLASHLTVTYTTASLAAGITEYGTVIMAPGYRVLHLSTSGPCRVRLYGSVAEQTTDAARAWGVDPVAGLALVLDYLTIAAMTPNLSPLADGSSTETAATSTVPISITNTDTGSAAVTVTITFVKTE